MFICIFDHSKDSKVYVFCFCFYKFWFLKSLTVAGGSKGKPQSLYYSFLNLWHMLSLPKVKSFHWLILDYVLPARTLLSYQSLCTMFPNCATISKWIFVFFSSPEQSCINAISDPIETADEGTSETLDVILSMIYNLPLLAHTSNTKWKPPTPKAKPTLALFSWHRVPLLPPRKPYLVPRTRAKDPTGRATGWKYKLL